MGALAQVGSWPAETVAVAVVRPGGEISALRGPADRPLPWASVTKLLSALVVLTCVEDGLLELDEPAGPPGSTVRHLLAHASGLSFEGDRVLGLPGERRVYSNAGFDVLAELVSQRAGLPFAAFVPEGFLGRLEGSAGAGYVGPLADLVRLATLLLDPGWWPAVEFPGLAGVLPGFGRQEPNDWGLGFEIRGRKSPHWTGAANSPRTFGHFGQSGTFLWIDPDAGLALACLTDLAFGAWAKEAWPRLSDAVLAEFAAGAAAAHHP